MWISIFIYFDYMCASNYFQNCLFNINFMVVNIMSLIVNNGWIVAIISFKYILIRKLYEIPRFGHERYLNTLLAGYLYSVAIVQKEKEKFTMWELVWETVSLDESDYNKFIRLLLYFPIRWDEACLLIFPSKFYPFVSFLSSILFNSFSVQHLVYWDGVVDLDAHILSDEN